jgi:putative membrane protein
MKLSKKSIIYRTLSRAGGGIFALAFIFPPALLLLPVILIAYGIYEYYYWKNFEFHFEDGDLKIRSGVITKNELDIPVRRIQDIDTSRNIIQRIIGISKVNVKTAGGDTSKASLKYLEEEQAEKVREQLRKLKNRRKQEEKDETSENEERKKEEFYNIGDALLTYSLVKGAGAVAIISSLIIAASIGLTSYFASSTAQILLYGAVSIIGAILLSAIVLISRAFSTYSKYYDFKITKRGDTFEYERGLFNKQGGSIPEEKIQNLVITENFIMRYLGYASLKVETAGVSSEEELNLTSTKTLIPFDNRQKVYNQAEKLSSTKIKGLERIAERSKTRYFRRYLLISTTLLLTGIGLTFIGFNPLIFAIPAAGFILSKKAAELKWENIGYMLDSENLVTSRGFWNRKTHTIPYFRIQNLMVTESPFQRHWKLTTVTVDTAGNQVTNPQIIDIDREKAFNIEENLYQKFKASIY